MGPRPRSGQPAARSSSSQASDASWAAAHTGASASGAPSARSDAPASGSISSQPSASSAATTIGTRSGSRCERRWRIAASARKWSQHALNQRVPSDVGTSSTAEMDHTRCVRTGSVRRRPRALRQSSIQASTRSYHPAWNQSGRCRGALPACCASAVPTRAPNGSARSPTGSQVPPATRSGCPLSARTWRRSARTDSSGWGSGIGGAACTPSATCRVAVRVGSPSSSSACTKVGSAPSSDQTVPSWTSATWWVRVRAGACWSSVVTGGLCPCPPAPGTRISGPTGPGRSEAPDTSGVRGPVARWWRAATRPVGWSRRSARS